MKINLNSIYKYTKILLMTLIIINMINACAKAVTIQEFLEYNDLIEEKIENEYGSSSGMLATCRAIKNNPTSVENAITKNYIGIVGISNNSTYDIRIICFNSLDSFSVNANGSLNLSNSNRDSMYRIKSNGSWHLSSFGQNASSTSEYNCYGLIDKESTNGYNDNCLVNVEFITNPFYFGHMYSSPITYSGETIEANTLDYNYRIEFIENIVTEQNEVESIDATIDLIPLETQNLGSYWTLKSNNSTLLKYNKIYKVEAKITTPDDIYIIEENMIFVPPGTVIENGIIIRTPSGDFTFSTENATNQIIDNNNNFFTDLNEMLFAFNSGDIQNAIDDIKEKFNFSGDEAIEKEIIEIAMQNNGDFKITWNAFTPHLSVKNQALTYERPMIPSGEINFSQIERENEAFQQTMYWTRLILSFALITLIAREYTKLILDAVGGSVLLADHDKESNRIIDGGDKK